MIEQNLKIVFDRKNFSTAPPAQRCSLLAGLIQEDISLKFEIFLLKTKFISSPHMFGPDNTIPFPDPGSSSFFPSSSNSGVNLVFSSLQEPQITPLRCRHFLVIPRALAEAFGRTESSLAEGDSGTLAFLFATEPSVLFSRRARSAAAAES